MLKRMMGKLLKTKLQPMGNRLSVALLGLVAAPVFCAGLNDTGIKYCSDGQNNYVDCTTVAADSGAQPRQDGRFGRDAQGGASKLAKMGDGGSGFDFTQINNNGTVRTILQSAPGSNPGDWACTRDNVTGLLWEVKTTSGLHSQNSTFSWYSSDSTSDGGNPGGTSTNTCSIASCDTSHFVAAVNSQAQPLCGATNWRMPTVKELEGLSDFGRGSMAPTPGLAIDPTYFPNTPALTFWSGTASAVSGSATGQYSAWVVDATDGSAKNADKIATNPVRLVSGAL